MKNWIRSFWLVWISLMLATYFTIGVNKLVLGCYPTRQFIYLVLGISSVIGVVSALVSKND